MMIAAQAIEMRGTAGDLGAALASTLSRLRTIVPGLSNDRPMGEETDQLAEAISNGSFGGVRQS